jgi:hypothetical protein
MSSRPGQWRHPPPQFAYSKGKAEGSSPAGFRTKRIDRNRPVYGVGADVTPLEPAVTAMPDLTGNGIFGTVPGADEIADAVMKRILTRTEPGALKLCNAGFFKPYNDIEHKD